MEYLTGLLYTTPFQPIENTPQLINMTAYYSKMNEAVAEANGVDPTSGGPGVYAPYCWDVALVMAEYFHNYTTEYPGVSTARTGGNWSAFLQSWTGSGATGDLAFNEYLDPLVDRWTINNCDNTTC